MRLLLIVQRLGREGGMERFLEIVLPALVARGVDVHLIARSLDPEAIPAGTTAQQIAWADEHDLPDAAAAAAVIDASARFAPDAAIAQNVMDAGVVEALRSLPRLLYQVCDHRPFCPNGDRVFPRSGLICDARLGAACVAHAMTDGCAYGPRLRTLELIARRRRLRDAVSAADMVLVDSRYMRERAVANGVARARVVEIAQPLADDDYASGIAPHTSRVAFIGRFVPQKGLVSLIRALGTLDARQRPQLFALGDGPEREAAEREAARAGVVLIAPGSTAIAGVHAAIDEAGVIAVPSLWAEPFGRVGIEAFARERTVVAYDVGGVRSWLDDERNGLLVTRGDEAALGSAIARVLDDEILRGRLAAAGAADVGARRVGPFVDRLLALIESDSAPARSVASG